MLGGTDGTKVALVASFSEAAVAKGLSAADVIKEAAQLVGGGGGGRDNVAQAGGKDPERLDDALATAKGCDRDKLGLVRVLALDYGTARCGCAISDPTGTLATPLSAISPPDPERIAEVAREREADLVVVGLPVGLGGEEGEQARLTRSFASELGEHLDVPIETYDERLTTSMAARTAREGARADEDSLAAAHLLESYLASKDAQG